MTGNCGKLADGWLGAHYRRPTSVDVLFFSVAQCPQIPAGPCCLSHLRNLIDLPSEILTWSPWPCLPLSPSSSVPILPISLKPGRLPGQVSGWANWICASVSHHTCFFISLSFLMLVCFTSTKPPQNPECWLASYGLVCLLSYSYMKHSTQPW